ncbi:hypothetical protein ANN_20831 [Periplaneta americana]|uniref:Uncharacterized protein n=1 Tax=Periplaneta americana TaxID=6978 RepID=A0ABQ8SEG5_PERAM|nr:hypothetical protein ANN_20831 [Periplaneta americana]
MAGLCEGGNEPPCSLKAINLRKEEAEIPKRVMLTQPDGTRRKGRPRSRWIDGVDGDARALGVRNWRMVALDRDGWRRVLEEAKAQQ